MESNQVEIKSFHSHQIMTSRIPTISDMPIIRANDRLAYYHNSSDLSTNWNVQSKASLSRTLNIDHDWMGIVVAQNNNISSNRIRWVVAKVVLPNFRWYKSPYGQHGVHRCRCFALSSIIRNFLSQIWSIWLVQKLRVRHSTTSTIEV